MKSHCNQKFVLQKFQHKLYLWLGPTDSWSVSYSLKNSTWKLQICNFFPFSYKPLDKQTLQLKCLVACIHLQVRMEPIHPVTAQFSSARSNNLLQALKSTEPIFTHVLQSDGTNLLLKQLQKTSTCLNGLSAFEYCYCVLIGT